MDSRFSTTLGWLLGSALILVGFWLTGFYFLTGISLAALGFFWWPPSRRELLKRLQLPQLPVLYAAISICLLVVALFAFIGRFSQQLETQALEAGFPSVEAWREAQQVQDRNAGK